MLKKVSIWFVVYFLSCGLSKFFTNSTQGQIFFWIYTGAPILKLIFNMVFGVRIIKLMKEIAEGENQIEEMEEVEQLMTQWKSFILNIDAPRVTFFMGIVFAKKLVCTLAITWLMTVMFNLEFFIVYQIVTLAKCLVKEEENL